MQLPGDRSTEKLLSDLTITLDDGSKYFFVKKKYGRKVSFGCKFDKEGREFLIIPEKKSLNYFIYDLSTKEKLLFLEQAISFSIDDIKNYITVFTSGKVDFPSLFH